MHYMYFQTEYAHKTRNKCIKFKDYERNTTCLPHVLGVQLDVHVLTKLKGLYTCVTVPIFVQVLFNFNCYRGEYMCTGSKKLLSVAF